jgi:hypothetical protein
MIKEKKINTPHYHDFLVGAISQRIFDVDYNVGDTLVSKDNPNKEIGICTGFTHENTCVEINGKCFGGKTYFMKSEFIEYVVLNDSYPLAIKPHNISK